MQIIVNGLIAGVSIAVLALAFQCIYLPTRIFFIGLSGIYSLTPFIALTVVRVSGSSWLAVVTAVLLAALSCLACEWMVHAPLERKGASSGAHLIASLGSSIVFCQLAALVWGNDTRTLRTNVDDVVHLGNIYITHSQLLSLATGAALITACSMIFMMSNLGLRLRAMADNPTQFGLLGYNVLEYRRYAFILGAVLAAGTSLTAAYDIGFDPHVGLPAVVLAVVAVIIGGRGSFVGPVVGGLCLGIIRAQVVWYGSSRWQEAITFAMLAVVLLLRPDGLLGKHSRIEAAP